MSKQEEELIRNKETVRKEEVEMVLLVYSIMEPGYFMHCNSN